MALRAAKQLYPQLEIHFVAREEFAEAAKRIPWIEKVITLPAEKILGPLLAKNAVPGVQGQALGELAHWLAPLVGAPWDFIVNWSYSESSSYLTALLPGRVKLGYTRHSTQENTTLTATDGWSHYVQAVIQGGIRQNIHLTDILTTQLLTALQIHAGEPADAGDELVTSKSFFHLRMDAASELSLGSRWRDPGRKWVAFQLGAGKEEKTWDPASWASLAQKILKNHPEYGIALLGREKDNWREEAFLKALGGADGSAGRSVVSLVGKSDFDLWASVVSRCQWVFAGDTAAVHLASVLGTRVMNLSIGPVRLTETGPYGNGHYVLSAQHDCEACNAVDASQSEPKRVQTHTCSTRLKPETVYAAWSQAIGLTSRTAKNDYLSDAKIYRSRIRSSVDGGGVVYESIDSHPMQMGEWTSLVMGHIARAWYCGWVPPVGNELPRTRLDTTLIQKLRDLDQSSELLSKICGEANHTATLLNRRSERLRSHKVMPLTDREEIRELGNRLLELDKLIERLGKAHPPLQAFAKMSQVLMHNIQGEQLAELGKESAKCYRQLADGVTILRDWLKYTLKLARPVAIVPGQPTDRPILTPVP
jgi:ADP-heptose:LPS heptosyltransferase